MKAGIKDPIAFQRGVAVYTEVNERAVTIPWKTSMRLPQPAVSRFSMSNRAKTPADHRRGRRGPQLGRWSCSGQADARHGQKARVIALLGLCCAGAVSAPAARPLPTIGSPTRILSSSRRAPAQPASGDGVRAYQTPEGTCVVFGDFLNALDVPMKIDLARRKPSAGPSRKSTGYQSMPPWCRNI
jgi:hypothetical protein